MPCSRYWHIKLENSVFFTTIPLFDNHAQEKPLAFPDETNTTKKLQGWVTVWWKLHDPNCRLCLIHRVMDRERETGAIKYIRCHMLRNYARNTSYIPQNAQMWNGFCGQQHLAIPSSSAIHQAQKHLRHMVQLARCAKFSKWPSSSIQLVDQSKQR